MKAVQCDVLVLGGGGAGLAAAVAAARAGAHTVLMERNGTLGGMATAALVHSICGLYLLREEPGAVLAHRGIPGELAARLLKAGASGAPVRMGRMDVLPHAPAGFAVVAGALAASCASLEVLLHSDLCAVTGSGTVESVGALRGGERVDIEPRTVVDASGDGALAALAGAQTDQAPPERLQRPAFIFTISGADTAALGPEERIRLAHQIATQVQGGRLDPGCLGAQFRASGPGPELFVTIDLAAGPGYDPVDARQLEALKAQGRALALQLCDFLRAEHPAFARCAPGTFPERLGVRESRRVHGLATVTGDDVLQGRAVADEVAVGTWPMEIRERATGPRWRYPEGNRPTPIPLGALRAAGLGNLWMAGRCISCDHEAQAALRVIGTCLATGQAAGLAAALQAAGNAPTAEAVRALIEERLVPKEAQWS